MRLVTEQKSLVSFVLLKQTSLLWVMQMVQFAFGAPLLDRSSQHSMAIKKLSPHWPLIRKALVLHLAHRTPISLSGTLSQRQGCIGMLHSTSIQDTKLIILRLRGHRDQITAINFIPTTSDVPSTSTFASMMLLTTAKDTFMKLWDLSTQHCIQTIVAHRSDIWAMDVNIDRNIIFTGSAEGEVKAWSIGPEAISKGLTESDSGDVRTNLTILHLQVAHLSFLDYQNYTPHSCTSSSFAASCIPNLIPSHSTIPRCTISRSIRRSFQNTH